MSTPYSRTPASEIGNGSLFWWNLLLIVAAMAVVTARLCDTAPLRSANDRSRWCTVWSLVERGTYQIDEIRERPGWDTIDLVRHDGHFYSSKPPLLPRLVAELYRVIKRITGWSLTGHPEELTRIILFLINVLPMGLALWYFLSVAQRYCTGWFAQAFLAVCACWGTMLLPYLTVFNNHTVAATAFLVSLPLLIEILYEGREDRWRYAACGLMTAWGACNELPAVLFLLLAGLALLRRSPRRTLTVFLPAALIPIAAFLITNYQVAGGLRPFYAFFGTEKYEFVHEGVPSYWMNPQGIDRPRDSTWVYLLHCTFGHHGIFSLSPIYLLALAGWVTPIGWRTPSLKGVILLAMLLTVVTLGFYLLRTESYNYSGITVALRWMLWLTPFWLLAMIPVLNTLAGATLFRVVALGLLAPSVFSAWYPASAPWAHPWIFRALESAGWIDYSDPRPAFLVPHHSWIGSLPEGDRQPDYWIRFGSYDHLGHRDELELSDAGPSGSGLRQLRVIHRRSGEQTSETTYLIDVRSFRAGRPVKDFLAGKVGGELTDEDRQFFSGVPGTAIYHGSRIRYVKTPLRVDAFRCHVGYAVASQEGPDRHSRQFVRDAWYCEEVPFGVLKWEDRILTPQSHLLLGRRHWEVIAAGTLLPPSSP